ncbi:hypothetical protein G6F50_018564 [Rhizopus delemar]|uniref:Uncharacterized protein n=1 Tax=Rhizopus delemar TaxID=936053 RepID=A0A9P7BY53_9FUNG|nr:hypothetical protein G6F50_018564 [Rhizopus delemar]
MRLEFTHSHIYPGATASLTGEQAELGERTTCLVELSDGGVLSTSWLIQGGEIMLFMPDYLTARGAKIPAKDWVLRKDLETGAWKAKSKVAV